MKRLFSVVTLLLGLSVSVLAQSVAPAPSLINFQGRLTNSSGIPIADGTYSLRLSLWDAEAGGVEKWSQTLNSVAVKNGTFAALLTTSTSGLFDANRWLEIKIGIDTPLSPRQQIVSVPFALKANTVPDNSIANVKIQNIDWAKVYNRPSTLLSLPYSGSVSAGHPTYVAFIVSNTASGGDAIAGSGDYSGVRGSASSASGSAGMRGDGFVGVLGSSSSTTGYGVQGTADNGGGRGVFGQAYQGVYGKVGGSSGFGVYGDSGTSVGWAVYAHGPGGGTSAWRLDSDARYKTHVETFPNALDSVLNLRGVTFDWNRDDFKEKNYPIGKQIGFIAQEIERVLPEIVFTDANGYKSVAYESVVPVLVEAMKRQQGQIVAQQQQLDKLRKQTAEIAELKAQLAALTEAVREIRMTQGDSKSAQK